MVVDLKTELQFFQQEMVRAGRPFVSYRLPYGSIPVTLFGPDDFIRFENISEVLSQPPGFVLAPFDQGAPLLWLEAVYQQEGFDIDRPLNEAFHTIEGTAAVATLKVPGQPVYEGSVSSAIQQIKEGKAGKVVLSRPIVHPWQNAFDHAGELFGLLCSLYPRAFVYIAHIPGSGLWAGASPEILLTSREGSFQTMSLSGTRKKAGFGVPWGQKEIDEHLWVTRFIDGSLRESGCESLETSPMHTAIAGEMEHLRTNFSGYCSSERLPMLINALHPTPAVCGWPTPAAREIIRELEDYDRSFYTGYLGPVNGKADFSLYVNLRCMNILEHQAVIYVGGGITADSDPRLEWEETVLKSRTMLAPIEKLANFAG